MNRNSLILLLVIIGAFAIRVVNFTFPSFTTDEARIAYRGYTLATTGKDELGRVLPVLFNSLEDYHLPVVSYLTAGGELIFGKSEFGVRVPFILLGTILVFLVYQIAKFFSNDPHFWFISASIISFSPVLIFLSKIPNETIVLTFLLSLIFYLILSKKNILLVVLTMIITILTSKYAWFILFPFTLFTLIFCQNSTDRKVKFMLVGLSVVLTFLAFTVFLTIPQGKRSLMENNFSISSSITITNGINTLRGQGIKADGETFVDKLLFNKGHFLTTGFLHWLSNISPANYFGQLDGNGKVSYSYIGALAKVLIVPFSLGLIFLISGVNKKNKLLLFYFFILTYPAIFMYPTLGLGLVVLTLPFMALVISFGFGQLSKPVVLLVSFLLVIEVSMNVFLLMPEYKNTTNLRPTWVKGLAGDIFEKSKVSKIAISDDIVSDIVPFIQWHTSFNPQTGFEPVPFPYKFRQYNLADIKMVGFEGNFTTCDKDEKVALFISQRDFKKIRSQFDVEIINTYRNDIEEKKVYLTEKACIR